MQLFDISSGIFKTEFIEINFIFWHTFLQYWSCKWINLKCVCDDRVWTQYMRQQNKAT